MIQRKVYKVLREGDHVIGVCYLDPKKSNLDDFLKNIVSPVEVINVDWKLKAYELLFQGELKLVPAENYCFCERKFIFSDLDLSRDDLYVELPYQDDKDCWLRLITLYRTGDVCPWSGDWWVFNDKETMEIDIDMGKIFYCFDSERAFHYFILLRDK